MYRLLAYILVGGLTGWLTTESQPSFLRCVSFFIYVFAIAQTIKKNFTLKFLFFFWFAFFLGQNFWLIHLINPINHPLLSVGAPLWIIMSGLLAIPFILLKKLYPINREPTELLSSLSCLTLFELFRNFFLSGFPFYSTISLLSWLKFYPAILGFTGIFIGSLLVLCATIFPIIFWKKLVSYLPAAFLACIVYPQTFFDHNKVAKIAVLQSHDDPYDESFFTRFSFCKDQVRSFKNIDCVIFPEGFWSIQYFDSFPLDLELHEKQKLESYARQMLELSKELDVDILLPFTHVDSEQNLFQSLGLIHKGELVGRYDKMHLMTLMESKWPILKDEWCDAIGVCNFVSGKEKTVLKGKYRYGPYICFDDYFEDDLYYYSRQNADILVSVHNDIWINHPTFKVNHFDQAVFRSIQTGVTGVRCANGGVCGVVFPNGEFFKTCDENRFHLITIPLMYSNPFCIRFSSRFLVFIVALIVFSERFFHFSSPLKKRLNLKGV